jgi:amidase
MSQHQAGTEKLLDRRAFVLGASAAAIAGCTPDLPAKPAGPKPVSDILGNLDGLGTAEKIRKKEFTAAEALEAVIARAEWADSLLNFLVSPVFDQARSISKAQQADGLFAGVPTLVKDLLDLKGAPTFAGCRALAMIPKVAEANPEFVAAMLRAGLNPIGKSTTPEFGFTCTTEPLLTGKTLNPWNTDYSCGGSSGGAAVAVASGVVPVAHASDGGGSIRIPASCCGLFGLKVSRHRMLPGRIPTDPILISVNNCVSRTVRDSAAWTYAMQRTGPDTKLPPIPLVTEPSKKRLRIGVIHDALYGPSPHEDVAKTLDMAVSLLSSLGHEVRPHRIPIDAARFAKSFLLYWAAIAADVAGQITARLPFFISAGRVLEPLTIGLANEFNTQPKSTYEDAINFLRQSETQYDAQFSDIDMIVSPVLARPPVRIGELAPELDYKINRDRLLQYVTYTPLANATGTPSMSVPLGMSADGLPVGVMFSAAKGEEAALLGLAFELEQAAPWAGRKPKIWAGV